MSASWTAFRGKFGKAAATGVMIQGKNYNSRETKSDDTIGLGDLSLLLKLTEDGVPVKLWVLKYA